jgi:hypothetical protein
MNKDILIQYIPHATQRYDTWGDWYYTDKALIISVSNDLLELDADKQFLVALHELIEVRLCEKRGITQKQVDDFDMSPVTAQLISVAGDEREPGDLPHCPYRKEHRFAMLIEHLMAHELGITGYGEVV